MPIASCSLLLRRRWCWRRLTLLLPVQHLIQHITKVGSSRSRRSSGFFNRCRAALLLGLGLLRLHLSLIRGSALLLLLVRLALIISDCRVLLLLWRILLVLLLLLPADRIQNAADTAFGLSVRRLAGSSPVIFLAENGAQNSGSQLGGIFGIRAHVFKFHLRDLLEVRSDARMLERS